MPFLIGAKKGLPNFNEFSLRNVAQVTRKLEVRKRTAADLQPFQTNLMYLLTLTNQFGIELWNSYTNPYPRARAGAGVGSFSLAADGRAAHQHSPGLHEPALQRELRHQYLGVATASSSACAPGR